MRLIACLLLGWSASTAFAQMPAARYQPLLDNQYVNVSALDLSPRYQAPLYQNTHEVFWIALTDGTVTFVAADGARTELQFWRGDTRLIRSYQVRSVRNESAAVVQGVIVEIKLRGLMANACYCTDKVESTVCGCGTPDHLPQMWATGIGKIMVGGTTLAAGQSYDRAAQRGETLLVALAPLQLLDEAAEAPMRIDLEAGQVAWIKAGWHKFKNVGPAAARFISFEF